MDFWGNVGRCFGITPENKILNADLYLPRIDSGAIDLRARLYRECEAMVAHIGARSIALTDEIENKIGILDTGIETRDQIPMSKLVSLHDTLATAIKPALPQAVELVIWDARAHEFYHRFAPVQSLRVLMCLTAVFLVIFGWTIVAGPITSENLTKFIVDVPGVNTRAWLLTFFLSLAGIGATFAVLYDARRYVIKGEFDPVIASNYVARILLGLVAGLLLSQVLSDKTSSGTPSPLETVGMPILALIGGFAAQFVYAALKRIVDALESIFRPEKEINAAYEKLLTEHAKQNSELEKLSEREAKIAALTGQLANATTKEERDRIISELSALGAASDSPADGEATNLKVIGGDLGRIEAKLQSNAATLDVLPEDDAAEERKSLAELKQRAADAKRIAGTNGSADIVGIVRTLGREVTEFDPLRPILRRAVAAMLIPAGGPLAAAGVALAIIKAAGELRGGNYARWQARILGAPVSGTDLFDETEITETLSSRLFSLPLAFSTRLKDVAESQSSPLEIVRNVLKGSNASLFGRFGNRFDNKKSDFDDAVDEFRNALVNEDVIESLTPNILGEFGQGNASTLLTLVDKIRDNPATRSELERLVVLAGATIDPENPIDADSLRDLVIEITAELTPGK